MPSEGLTLAANSFNFQRMSNHDRSAGGQGLGGELSGKNEADRRVLVRLGKSQTCIAPVYQRG